MTKRIGVSNSLRLSIILGIVVISACGIESESGSPPQYGTEQTALSSQSIAPATSEFVLAHEKVGQLDLSDPDLYQPPPTPPYDLTAIPSANRDELQAAGTRALAVGARFGLTSVMMFQTPDGALYADVIDDKATAANAASLGMIDRAPGSAGSDPMDEVDPFVAKALSGGVDNRTYVGTGSGYGDADPEFRNIGHMSQDGTGTTIGRRLVLTACHINGGGFPPTGSFAPRQRGATLPYGSSVFNGVGYPAAFASLGCFSGYATADPCAKYDWAVNILPDPSTFTSAPGYMGFEWSTDASIASRSRKNVGYPDCSLPDPPAGCVTNEPYGDISDNCGGVTPTFALGSTSNFWPYADGTNPFMKTGCDISPGHSGGPIYEPGTGGPWVMSNVVWRFCDGSCTPSEGGDRINQTMFNYLLSLRTSYP
jgi:hypothetical protein